MAVTATPIYPQTVKNAVVSFVNADGTTVKTVLAGGTNGTQITAITVSSTDSANRDIKFWLTVGGTDYLLCTVQIPINSGNTNAIAPVDIFRSTMVPGLAFDALGNRVLHLSSTSTLRASMGSAVTAATTVSVVVTSAGDF